MKIKLIQFIVFSVMFFFMLNEFSTTSFAKSNQFLDVPQSHWAFGHIHTMVDHQIMSTENEMFYPEKQITRAEAAQYIFNSLNIESKTLSNFEFIDVPKDASYANAVYTLVSLNVLQKAKKFNPQQRLTRAQLSKMISIAFEVEVDKVNHSKFKDVNGDQWAQDYIESLADINVLKGAGNQYFKPNGHVTRAQMAAILEQIIHFKKQVDHYEIVYDYLQKDYIPSKNQYPGWSSEVVNMVNEIRQKEGLSPLELDLNLTKIAVVKANDMIKGNYFEHESPFYGHPWDMAGIFDYSFTSYGENLARNIATPQAVVDAWINSPSHRENILNDHFTHIGVSCVLGHNGQLYWVQHFSSKPL